MIASTLLPALGRYNASPDRVPHGKAADGISRLADEGRSAGARGAVVGRNAWGHPKVTAAVRAIKAHDHKTPVEAMKA